MKRNDTFIRTYPLAGVILFLVLALAPLGFSVAAGAQDAVKLVSDRTALMALADCLCLSAACTLAALLLGLPGARIMARTAFPCKGILRWLYCVMTLVPVFYIRLCCKVVPFPSIGKPWMWEGAVLALLSVPSVVFITGEFWRRLDPGMEQCASSLKTPGGRIYRTITMPRIRAAATASALYVFARCFTYMMAAKTTVDALSSSLNVICAIIGLLVLIPLFITADKAMCRKDRSKGLPQQKPCCAAGHIFVFIYVIVSLCVAAAPLVLILLKSIRTPEGFSFTAYIGLFKTVYTSGSRTFICSLILLAGSLIISLLIALRISYGASDSRFVLALALAPLAMGPYAFASGMRGLFAFIPSVPLIVPGILSHTVMTVPFMVLVLTPAVRRVPDTLRNVSRSLGYSESRSFMRMDRKLLGPHIAAACFVGAAASLGDFGASFISGLASVPVQIDSFISTGDLQHACALGFILTLICLLSISIGRAIMRKSHV
ncbi:MAG: hypothetical protein J5775_06275 [Spirochaetales bacterium]|nr:hypothetical protein [Spirochaetales bacterium]